MVGVFVSILKVKKSNFTCGVCVINGGKLNDIFISSSLK
jgi:hypothetical protein